MCSAALICPDRGENPKTESLQQEHKEETTEHR
jgi:hypothetical protein